MAEHPSKRRHAVGKARQRLTPDGFAERFKAESRSLWCIAAAMLGDRIQADDVLQESAMIALGKLEQFDPDTSFIAWMSQIVRFVALNHARRRNARRTVNLEAAAHVDDRDRAARPAPITSWGDLAPGDDRSFDDRVLAALRRLDPTARACLLLRVVDEQSYREIAKFLDIPEGTAMSHVHRARRALAARLAGTHGAAP